MKRSGEPEEVTGASAKDRNMRKVHPERSRQKLADSKPRVSLAPIQKQRNLGPEFLQHENFSRKTEHLMRCGQIPVPVRVNPLAIRRTMWLVYSDRNPRIDGMLIKCDEKQKEREVQRGREKTENFFQ